MLSNACTIPYLSNCLTFPLQISMEPQKESSSPQPSSNAQPSSSSQPSSSFQPSSNAQRRSRNLHIDIGQRNNLVHKRLFIFCDGTWQDGVNGKAKLTNVATLARCIEPVADDGYLQIVYYDNGVGNGTGGIAKLVDGATGRGISAKIRNAYSFLSHNYNFDSRQDEIFLIGFSRGAFAVQCLASFLNETGLLKAQGLSYLRGLFSLWQNQAFRRIGLNEKSLVQTKMDEYVETLREKKILQEVSIKACVVWDTVAALGLPTPWSRPLSFVGRGVPKAVENAFQVLALDEIRAQFKPRVWDSKEGKTHVKQCWFLGSHADVCGGGDAALGAVTLIWVIAQLRDYTSASFKMGEVSKHLRLRYMDWDFKINRVLGQFKETLTFFSMSKRGRVTKPSWYWWVSGFQSRGGYLQFGIHEQPELLEQSNIHNPDKGVSVHFTVRLAMAKERNVCRPLRKWKTTISNGDVVVWERGDSRLFEDKLSQDEGQKGYIEYRILQEWGKMKKRADLSGIEPGDNVSGELVTPMSQKTLFAAGVWGIVRPRKSELNQIKELADEENDGPSEDRDKLAEIENEVTKDRDQITKDDDEVAEQRLSFTNDGDKPTKDGDKITEGETKLTKKEDMVIGYESEGLTSFAYLLDKNMSFVGSRLSPGVEYPPKKNNKVPKHLGR
ncbi:hypothetical protein GGR54DRAFT_262851 [Hypoxylon sp. NC1633]|nr:hypothetical protein GGR54DRAFT_262851 [Hypoxylon sp. NC1633]